MITVLENRDFIEGVFPAGEEAEQYLKTHPDTSACRLYQMDSSTFPLYALEIEWGKFRYFEQEKAFITFLREMDITRISRKKAFVSGITDAGQTFSYKTDDGLFTLYVFREPFRSGNVNQDFIGLCEHYHLAVQDRENILRLNTLACLWQNTADSPYQADSTCNSLSFLPEKRGASTNSYLY